MNFHIFVLIATIIFYVIFRFYKYQVQNESNKKKSFLIYVLLIPGLLYLTKFIFNIQNNNFSSIEKEYKTISDIKMSGGTVEIPIQDNINSLYNKGSSIDVDIEFDPVLTIPYPESSIYLSSN
jgi:hypothetical protein